MKGDLELELGRSLDVAMDGHDPNTVVFRYPCAFSDLSILREIRLESGSLAAWTPAAYHGVRPYAADFCPQLFRHHETQVYTVEPERTFWEKATILHREAMRTPERGPMPSRCSRHYYDLLCMIRAGTKDAALGKIGLLDEVVAFKRKFYRCSWARYELATRKESPPVDAGPTWAEYRANGGLSRTDLNGKRRNCGNRLDIGCCETQPTGFYIMFK